MLKSQMNLVGGDLNIMKVRRLRAAALNSFADVGSMACKLNTVYGC